MNVPAVKAAGGEALIWVRRLTAARTLRGLLAAVFRGIGRVFVWYRGWLAAVDKSYLIENGASPLNKAQHNYWCFWRRKTSQYTAALLALILTVLTFIKGFIVLFVFGLLVISGLALVGRKPDKPIVTPRNVVATKPRIDGDLVRKVVASATAGMKAAATGSGSPGSAFRYRSTCRGHRAGARAPWPGWPDTSRR